MAASKGLLSKKWIRGLLVGAAAAAIAIVLWATGILDGPENTTWDLRVRQFAHETAITDNVVVIYVDQTDLDMLAADFGVAWPWPRSIYSYIVDYAHDAGAASVTFDIILEDEGSGTWQDDVILQYSASHFGRTVWGAEFRGKVSENNLVPADQRSSGEPWPAYIEEPDITVTGLDQSPNSDSSHIAYLEASFPFEFVIPPDAPLAFVNQDNDADGVFRRYNLLLYHLDQPVVALGIGSLLLDGPLEMEFRRHGVDVNGIDIPLDSNGTVLLRFSNRWALPTNEDLNSPPEERGTFYATEIIYSALDMAAGVEPSIPPSILAGKNILIGFSASGLLDLRPTPIDPRAPGVIVHATMLDNLLSGEFMRDLPVWATVIMLLVLTMGAAMLATYASGVLAEAGLFVGFVAIVLGLGIGGYLVGFWVPMVVPLVAVVLAVATGNIANYATEGAQKRFIRGAFSQYLSNDVITQLESDPDKLKLGGERRDLTMYFSDVEGFTSISERLEPEQLTALINAYLTPMTDIIQQSAGTIDKYEGDAIIAFWNAPLEFPDHAARGVHAALECQRRLNELNPEFSKVAGTNMKMRIGLNTGPAVVGNMGSHTRFDYTMLGDAVNLAARLESANKQFGTYTMISKNTLDQLGENGDPRPMGFVGTVGDIAVRELGRLVVKGKKEPVTVYEAMMPAELVERRGTLDAFGAALRLYYNAEFRQASEAFRAIESEDPAAAKYVQACLPLIDSPPVSWDGRMTLEAK